MGLVLPGYAPVHNEATPTSIAEVVTLATRALVNFQLPRPWTPKAMAVLLCRGDGKPFPTPPPLEMRGLPRIVVNYEPVPEHTSYLGKTVEARTEVLFNCKDQTREEFWRKSRKR